MLNDKGMPRLLLLASLLATSFNSAANEVQAADTAQFKALGQATFQKSQSKSYIIQLKDPSGVTVARTEGDLTPSNPTKSIGLNSYNPLSDKVKSHTDKLEQLHQKLAQGVGIESITHSYKHTFNGFSAQLTDSQLTALKANPEVIAIWEDELQKPLTANTPTFLGLTASNGQHTLGIKGEDIIVGVVDTGIWPEHPSFADDGSYSDPTELGWTGSCDAGEDEEFTCNNKLIGAQYFNDTFASVYDIIDEEFISPRDADGHGSHTASTAAGNEGVTASLYGTEVGTVSGIAPRARVAMYKACWNSDYENEDGDSEAGCFYGDTMAAIDQAVADGVDVINYSIGGSLTDLTTAAATSMLTAEQAGVFVAVSAGNSGPDEGTVGTPAPWVMSVAASTYTGTSATNAIYVTTSDEESAYYESVEGSITQALIDSGDIEAPLVAASPIEACFDDGETATELENSAEIEGNIALIARGSCTFVQKIERAYLSGAVGVVVYSSSDSTVTMGGDESFEIPGVMISLTDGETLVSQLESDLSPTVKLSVSNFIDSEEVGNIMAEFSSRGPNLATADLIKPDITAPGVRILAATTEAPAFDTQGESFAYLQGTSMSAPHVAGMAALLKEQNPDWTPAVIKSALMTTSYQDVVKEDEETAADPFDFGAGHAAPVSAMDPGLVYEADFYDYMAFMCGLSETDFVSSVSGYSCDAYESAGYDIDPSELNVASIAISELSAEEEVSRTVTNISGSDSIYTATIEAPAGVDVSLVVDDEDDQLIVAAGESAQYTLVFTPTDEAVEDEWAFGSITWTDSAGHTVYSPIAVQVVAAQLIEAPDSVTETVSATSDRFYFTASMNYSGTTSQSYVGLTAPGYSSDTIPQDEDSSFSFYEDSLGKHFFHVSDDTKVLRFALTDDLVSVEGADLDLYVYRCESWSCSFVGSSTNSSSEESVTVTDPEAADDISVGDVYLVMVHAYDIDGTADAEVTYYMPSYFVDSADTSTTRVYSSSRAIDGRSNIVLVYSSGLEAGTTYMGAVSFFDSEGTEQDVTILEVTAE